MLNERLWWLNAPQGRLTTNPLLKLYFLWVLFVLTFCRNHAESSQAEDQEGALEELKEFVEFIFFPG